MKNYEKLTGMSRKDGWFYTEEGHDRLIEGGHKGHALYEKSIAEKLGNRHRMYMPLTQEAARAIKSVKGYVRKVQFLNTAVETAIKEMKKKGGK